MKKFLWWCLHPLLAVKAACMRRWPFESAPDVYHAGWNRPDPDEEV